MTLLKMETVQPSGSFKSRGMTRHVEESIKSCPDAHFVASSGGNAGFAVAEAATSAGRPCTVVVPETSSPRVLARLRKLGATAITHGSIWAEANSYLQDVVAPTIDNAVMCHPFDNEAVWEGHSTLVTELVDQLRGEAPGGIVLSCGGGGLYIGVMRGLERVGWTHVPVFVVETEKASCFAAALKAGEPVNTHPCSIAKSLGASVVCEEAFRLANLYNTTSVVVTDEEAVAACRQFADDHCQIVEPACGATLAAIYTEKVEIDSGPLVAIVCGGSTWTATEVAIK